MLPAGWKVHHFGEVTVDASLGVSARGFSGANVMPLIKMGNLKWGSLELSDIEHIDQESVPEELYLQTGDFLFNTRNTIKFPRFRGHTERLGRI